MRAPEDIVTPAPGFRRDRVAGVQKFVSLDSGFRRNDRRVPFLNNCESIELDSIAFPNSAAPPLGRVKQKENVLRALWSLR